GRTGAHPGPAEAAPLSLIKKGLSAPPKRPATWLAMLGFAGFAPLAPATVGSALTAFVGWWLPVPSLPVFAVLFMLGTAVAVWAAGEAERELGHDAGPIVIDEAVGQTLALVLVPHTVGAFVSAFVLFRIFDVWKPFGAREAQHLPGGLGVVADDAIAGLTTCLAGHGLLLLQSRLGWTLL
ncbi:MAG: phosphatidylglycerophosphatase A, partial [bacterium]